MKRLRFILIGDRLQEKQPLNATIRVSIEFNVRKTGERVTKKLGVFETDNHGYASFELFKILPEEKEIELRHLWLSIAGDSETERDLLDQYLRSPATNLLLIHVPYTVWHS